jgi:hypothetical protein
METRDDTLQRFFFVERQLFLDRKKRLAEMGFNFGTYKELRAAAESFLIQAVDYEGLIFIPVSKPVFAHKGLQPIGYSTHIQVHEV